MAGFWDAAQRALGNTPEQKAELKAKVAEAKAIYQQGNARIKEIDAELSDLRSKGWGPGNEGNRQRIGQLEAERKQVSERVYAASFAKAYDAPANW
jgi:chromosome segregation ATPase